MLLIIGLGNPGIEYAFTRHNMGFIFIDYISDILRFPIFKTKFDSLYTEKIMDSIYHNRKIILQKPQTFMNLSGKAVAQIVSFYKIDSKNIIAVHDDIDLPQLEVRIKFGGSNGGHNGLRSIDGAIGKAYWKIRIGVGRPMLKEQVANHVLSKFSQEVLDLLPSLFDDIINKLSQILNSK
ncbi:MAG: aminoacyl-tRNA hydrolase [Holosporales bacterium]|nr:aminoacyl-tRNA hydrolase [Holosporales bacterium]